MRELREFRERLEGQEQLLKSILTHLELSSEQFSPVWMPSKRREGMIRVIQLSQKIRKIEALPTKSHDIVGRLRTSWLGRLYIGYLKQYVVIRWTAYCVWRNGYPIYVNHIATRFSNRKAIKWLPLTKLSEFTKKNGVQTYKLLDAAIVETPKPKVFPTCDQDYLVSPHDRFIFPEIYVATVNNAMTYGGTNLILTDDGVVCHDLYDFERDYTSEELHGRTLIDPKSKRIRWLLHDEAPEAIPVAATFLDACALNYAHWMTEVLPRVVLFCAEDRFLGIPIVVNDGLHKNIMESLFLVAGTEREIITLPIGRALAVNKLYLTSVTGYVPFGRRTNELSGHSHGQFSPRAFELLRNHLNGLAGGAESEAWPEKIYLRRNSGTRKVTNATELEKLLVAHGYVIVEPEKLSFSEQIRLFSNTKIIVASSGAAMANIIFCPPASQIFILISKHPNTNYWYWQNMAAASGNFVRYIFGAAATGSADGIHNDFTVPYSEVEKLMEKL